MSRKAVAGARRKGITVLDLTQMFPDEDAARKWFEQNLWPEGRHCPRCGNVNTYACSHARMPYRCRDCCKYFSIRTGTVMAGSPLPLRTWLFAIYLDTTSRTGVSSMDLHRDLGITQKTAWHMRQRIREVLVTQGPRISSKRWANILNATQLHHPDPIHDDKASIGVRKS